MKLRLIGTIVLSSSILFIGCSNKASLEERQKNFSNNLAKLTQIGLEPKDFKPNKNKSSFIVEVKDSKKLANYILELVNLDTLDSKAREEVAKYLDTIDKFGVDVDWKKYQENRDDSIYAYLLDSDKITNKTLKELIQNKKLGVYLTFDNKDSLKRVKAKDLKLIQNSNSFTTKNLVIDIKKSSFNTNDSKAYDLKLGEIKVKSIDDNNIFAISNINCKIDQENKILGKQECKIEDLKFSAISRYSYTKTKTYFNIKNITFRANTYKNADILSSDGDIEIPDLLVYTKSKYENYNMQLKNYKFNFNSKGFKYQDLINLYSTLKDNNLTEEKKIAKMFEVMSSLYSNKIEMSGNSSYEIFDFNGTKYSKPLKLTISDYKGDFVLNSNKMINYSSNTSYNLLLKSYGRRGEDVNINLKGYSDKFTIKDLYNIIPDILNFAKESISKKPSNAQMQKVMKQIPNKLIHNGVGLSFSPKVKNLSIKVDKKNLELNDIDIALNLKLDKNNLDFTNPMSKLLALALIKGDGHIKMNKDSFENLLKLNPQASMIAAIYAKEENGKVVFNLELNGGKLLINGKSLK